MGMKYMTCGFDLHFPNDGDVEHPFMCLLESFIFKDALPLPIVDLHILQQISPSYSLPVSHRRTERKGTSFSDSISGCIGTCLDCLSL